MEGSEFGSLGREGRESDEDPEQPENNEREFDPEEIQRKAKEMVEAAERDDEQEPDIDGPEKDPGERAEKEAKEEEEKQDDAPKGELDEQEPSDEKKGEQDESSKPEEPEKEESPEKEDNMPQEEPEAEEVEKPVRDAVKELEREEEELRRAREEREAREQEVEEAKERAREEREASADQYPYDDIEKLVRDILEKHGVSAEDLEKQWQDRFVEDIAEELEGKTETTDAQEEETDEDAKSSGEGKAQEGSSYYEDGSGQMYAVEHDSSTSAEAKQETEGAMEGQEESQNTAESSESETKESSEPSEPLDDKESQQENPETRELESEPQGERTEDPQKQLEGEMEAEASETSETTPESKKKEIEQSVTSSTHETQERTPETAEKKPDRSDEKEPEPATESKEELDDSEPSPMFPEGMPKRGTMLPESREEKEQNWEEYVDKMWNELTEEEREEFKKKIRSAINDEEDVEELFRRHGSEHLLENEDAMAEISRYLEFQKRLDEEMENRTERELAIENIADELEIEQETAEKWAEYEELPDELHDLMASETQWLWYRKMRSIAEMGYPTTLEEIDEQLDTASREIVTAWLKIREMQENGEIDFIVKNGEEFFDRKHIRDLSFRYGIPEEEIRAWLKGRALPRPVRNIVLKRRRIIGEVRESLQGTEVDVEMSEDSDGFEVKMYPPMIDGELMESFEQVEEWIRENSPEFFSRKDAKRLLKDLRTHLELYNEFSTKEFIPKGEIAAIAKRTGKSPTVIKRWLRLGVMPQFYYLVDRVSKDTRDERIKALLDSLNGITDMQSMDERYATLYFSQEYSDRKFDAKETAYCVKFFKFLKEYASGGSLVDIFKKLKIGKTAGSEWLSGARLPSKLKYATLIPSKTPRKGWKWVPLKLDTLKNLPEQFIQVPLTIDSLRNLTDILKQLTPLKEENDQLLEGLGEFHSFMYLLGLLASDGSFIYDTPYSAALKLWASKKYSWSMDLGNAFCDAIRRLGFSVEQHSDDIRDRDGKQFIFQQWRSEASPFFMWMKQTLFGLSATEKKKEIPIKSDWILKMPRSMRVAFIQGLADGDGSASIRAFRTSIASKTNTQFIKKLLTSVGIRSTTSKMKVMVRQQSEILKAEKLPLFKFAISRKKKLEDLATIIQHPDRKYGEFSDELLKIVEDLHNQGFTPGQITEELWEKYRIPRSRSSVEKIVQRIKKKQKRG